MSLELVPFADVHLGAAAELLAEQVQTARHLEPSLSARFELAEEARKPLEFVWQLPMSCGVVASVKGQPIGFMLGLAFPQDVTPYALAPFSAVLESWDDERLSRQEILREMYSMLAEDWVESGSVGHYPSVPASEPELIAAWYSLGFGEDNVAGIRRTVLPPTKELARTTTVRRAVAEDEESIQSLYDGLGRHLAGTPTFMPPRPDVRPERQDLKGRLGPDWPDVYFLAEREGKAVGVQHWEPTSNGRPYLPEDCAQVQHAYTAAEERGTGVGTALFEAGLMWARESGYERCVVHWEPANIPANRFWKRQGFQVFNYRLGRLVHSQPDRSK